MAGEPQHRSRLPLAFESAAVQLRREGYPDDEVRSLLKTLDLSSSGQFTVRALIDVARAHLPQMRKNG